jgi:GMP synthase-like glutamine amidotransferase
MDVLAVIHGDNVRAGVFGDVVRQRGHRFEEWSLAWERPLPRPLDDYGAVLVFGGRMHADQDDRHPWLRDENFLLQRLLALRMPVLGVCLGAQLLAKAGHAAVYPSPEPEIGWVSVELTGDADGDPLFGRLPECFDSFQWHYYTYDVPAGGVELARSSACTQAFRLGEAAWGIQFHAEVTQPQIEDWASDRTRDVPGGVERLLEETRANIVRWNALGRELCGEFLEVAERVAAAA